MTAWDAVHPRLDLYNPDETRIDRLVRRTLHPAGPPSTGHPPVAQVIGCSRDSDHRRVLPLLRISSDSDGDLIIEVQL